MSPTHALSMDTPAEVLEILVRRWRSMSPDEKFRTVEAANRDCATLAAVGVRQRYPDATEREVHLRVAALRLGRDLSVAVYGWDPHIEGW